MPVRCVMNGGMGTPGFTSVSNTPIRSPPRYFTAPNSVTRESAGEPPVVSRSTTQNVTSRRGTPSARVVWAGWASTGRPPRGVAWGDTISNRCSTVNASGGRSLEPAGRR